MSKKPKPRVFKSGGPKTSPSRVPVDAPPSKIEEPSFWGVLYPLAAIFLAPLKVLNLLYLRWKTHSFAIMFLIGIFTLAAFQYLEYRATRDVANELRHFTVRVVVPQND